MKFDDFNYNSFNKFILIDPKKTPDDSSLDNNASDSEQARNEKVSSKKGWAPPKKIGNVEIDHSKGV
jgi:hypothetical protein